jgi:hypothetical protein
MVGHSSQQQIMLKGESLWQSQPLMLLVLCIGIHTYVAKFQATNVRKCKACEFRYIERTFTVFLFK